MSEVEAPTSEAADWDGEQLSLPAKAGDRSLLIALIASLVVHLSPAVVMLGMLALGGAGGGPSEDERRLGDEKGKLDGVNVEIIDAREYDRKYMSHTDGQGAGNDNVAPAMATPAKPVEAPEKPPEKPPEKEPEKPSEKPPEKSPEQQASAETQVPPGPDPDTPGGLTKAEADRLISSAVSEFERVAQATSKAAMAAYGSSSPAIRAILRKLKRAMPTSNTVRGTLVVRIVLNDRGGVASAGILQSSGKPALDKLVLESVRAALAPDPSTHLDPKERLLQITYEYF